MEGPIQLLADLVRIPSVNPMGRSPEGRGEAEIGDFIARYLRAKGADVTVSEVEPGRPCVIGLLHAGVAKTVMLEAHMDTVHGERMVVDPFDPVIRDGKLFGRGSCDTKGSLAAFLFAACSLAEHGGPRTSNVLLVAVPDEEYRFTGAIHAASQGLRADFGIAGEPTRLHIVRAHKGVTRWKVVTTGVSAHAAYPERGRNAIYRMGEVILRLEQYAALLRERVHHPLLGSPTLSVGVIEGGQAVNIVPDSCWIEVDRRTLPGETAASVLAPVRQLLNDIPGCTVEVPHLSVTGMDVPEDADVVRELSRAIREVTEDVVVETAPYATDAGIFHAAGIPTVVFGPGDIEQAHTENEYIDLAQFQTAITIVQRLLT